MKKDKRRLDRRWTDHLHAIDFGLIFAAGILVGVIWACVAAKVFG